MQWLIQRECRGSGARECVRCLPIASSVHCPWPADQCEVSSATTVLKWRLCLLPKTFSHILLFLQVETFPQVDAILGVGWF